MTDTSLTYEADLWEQDQKYCDIADLILKILADKKLTMEESYCVLDKAQKGVDVSVQSMIWGEPLVCGSAPSAKFKFFHRPDQITAEIERRRTKRVAVRSVTQAEYDALPDAEKNNGTRYLVQ